MSLVPDPAVKGLWRSSPPHAAGVHAVIIGISRYPHLDKGDGNLAPDNGGMGQLAVCAKTAARIFDWVKSASAIAGAPIATCRLLLGPTQAELTDVDALTQGHYGATDFKSVREAIEAWRDLLAAGASDPNPNVAFYFFSGHGVEHVSRPCLLCADILDPGTPAGPKNAVSFNALWQSVKTYGIDRALFFLDACRNASDLIRRLHIVGQDVIDPADYTNRWPDAVVWLQATQAGAFAYQLPTGDATFYGSAVLEALRGVPPNYEPYDCSASPWQLLFKKLESHAKQRVRELIQQNSANKLQLVEPGGVPYNGETIVAEMQGPMAAAGATRAPPPVEPGPGPAGFSVGPEPPAFTIAVEPTVAGLVHARSQEVRRTFKAAYEPDLAPLIATARRSSAYRGDLNDYSVIHRILGHEAATYPWISSLKILDPASGTPALADSIVIDRGYSQERGDRLAAWLDIQVKPTPGHAVWIQVGGNNEDSGPPSFAVVVPRDQNGPIPVRLDLTFRIASGQVWPLESMSARLAEPGEEMKGTPFGRLWSALWDIQRLETLADLATAGKAAAQFIPLEDTLAAKMESPIAAAIAAGWLLRSGALQYLHDWPRNLANLFEWLADGPVLWSETLMRRSERRHQRMSFPTVLFASPADRIDALSDRAAEDEFAEASNYFAMIAKRGPPLLTTSLSMAGQQGSYWRKVLAAKLLEGQQFRELTAACDVIDHFAVFAQTDGVFVGFMSHDQSLNPTSVFGNRERAA